MKIVIALIRVIEQIVRPIWSAYNKLQMDEHWKFTFFLQLIKYIKTIKWNNSKIKLEVLSFYYPAIHYNGVSHENVVILNLNDLSMNFVFHENCNFIFLINIEIKWGLFELTLTKLFYSIKNKSIMKTRIRSDLFQVNTQTSAKKKYFNKMCYIVFRITPNTKSFTEMVS